MRFGLGRPMEKGKKGMVATPNKLEKAHDKDEVTCLLSNLYRESIYIEANNIYLIRQSSFLTLIYINKFRN